MKFGHIGVRVRNLENSVSFYKEVLGCTVLETYDFSETRLIFLEAHGTVIELIHKDSNKSRGYGAVEHIAFKVESLDKEMDKLKASGIDTISETLSLGKWRIVFFDGPDNERIEFIEDIG